MPSQVLSADSHLNSGEMHQVPGPPPNHDDGPPTEAVRGPAIVDPPCLFRKPTDCPALSSTTTPPSLRCYAKCKRAGSVRVDLCCLCAKTGRCGMQNCPCSKARKPCNSCAPGKIGCCKNTIAKHNRLLILENAKRATKNRFRACYNKSTPHPMLPLYNSPLTGETVSKRSKITHAAPPPDNPV